MNLAAPFLKTVVAWDLATLRRWKQHGYAAVNYQVQNATELADFDFAATREAGLSPEVWGVTYSKEHFYRDGLLLGAQAVKHGAEGVTMNAEMCAKFTRSSRGLRPIIQGIRDGGWTGPVSLNTLGAPANPDVNDFEMDIQSFLETGGGVACQAYFQAFDEYRPSLCARYWRRMGVPEGKLNLTVGLYDPSSENPGRARLTGADYVPLLREAAIGRAISIFRPETALPNDLAELEAITLAPASPPSTIETREAIVAAAEAWEASRRPAPLARITLARRICSDEISSQRDWIDNYAARIAAILDGS